MFAGIEIWTVGHSDRSAAELLDLLRTAGVQLVVDVRRAPWSRRHPWHARAELERFLVAGGVDYRWMGVALGGGLDQDFEARRATDEYREGLEELLRLAGATRTAVMCAERDHRHCHRQFIADDLAARGAIVRHLVEPGLTEVHQPPLSF
jgi:uncharacterized protein (DUF488 family)